jgi:5-methyltetrahydropteroyltriglutamate--homocysteine methyltransferase
MVLTANLGFPRVGADRELKRALERHWRGELDRPELQGVARDLRARHWRLQQSIGIDHIPSNDFSVYDHVLDTAWMVGAVPEDFAGAGDDVGGSRYYALARGGTIDGRDVQALEMTKWFDTNYHYLVPELRYGQAFRPSSAKPVGEFLEAKQLGITTRPVILGPVSFLLLAKGVDEPLTLLPAVIDAYESVLTDLADAGATWVQVDEPFLALDLGDDERSAFAYAFDRLAAVSTDLRLVITSYFAGLGTNTDVAVQLPVDAVHLDLARAPDQLDDVLARVPDGLSLSLGVVDGRNVWRSDLDQALATVERAVDRLSADRVLVAPSCSLLHLPFDIHRETDLDPELQGWLAFAEQRLEEVAVLGRAVREGRAAVDEELGAARDALASHRSSPRVHRSEVAQRLAAVTPAMTTRSAPFAERASAQAERVPLPPLPTTTIGSFPQTTEVRTLRARLRRGDIDQAAYDEGIESAIRDAVALQEELGVDVLVHGEFERNDMVEYFGEQLDGFAFTQHGWVQSYGSRCVKPPIIYGDVRRPAPMTVRWSSYTQSLTDKPVKGMLTGPVTLLQWSFVRSDQPRSVTARQLALAIRDEVADLEEAGIPIIQIDEPALREGLPLRRSEWREYLAWAVEVFRLASSAVRNDTQIHTHMCYSEFNDILESIADLDADVISIEASRSRMELLQAFRDFKYPNDIGPGVWDIHSPRVPPTDEMVDLLERAETVLDPRQLWVNPDCGLKTRGWEEVVPGLANLVAAARTVRAGTNP